MSGLLFTCFILKLASLQLIRKTYVIFNRDIYLLQDILNCLIWKYTIFSSHCSSSSSFWENVPKVFAKKCFADFARFFARVCAVCACS